MTPGTRWPSWGVPSSTHEQRAALGYSSEPPALRDSASDAAWARAGMVARARKARIGRITRCEDRYASVVAEPIEQDVARTACLLAIRDWMTSSYSSWVASKGVEGQVREIAAVHRAAAKAASKGAAPPPSPAEKRGNFVL